MHKLETSCYGLVARLTFSWRAEMQEKISDVNFTKLINSLSPLYAIH